MHVARRYTTKLDVVGDAKSAAVCRRVLKLETAQEWVSDQISAAACEFEESTVGVEAMNRGPQLSPSTDLCSPFDVRILRCNNRTTPGAGPSKAAEKKNLEPAKKRWSRTSTSVAQIGVGGLWPAESGLLVLTSDRDCSLNKQSLLLLLLVAYSTKLRGCENALRILGVVDGE
jgi:hypothetical protein